MDKEHMPQNEWDDEIVHLSERDGWRVGKRAQRSSMVRCFGAGHAREVPTVSPEIGVGDECGNEGRKRDMSLLG